MGGPQHHPADAGGAHPDAGRRRGPARPRGGLAALTRYLARAGFSHLVLRNDLDVTEAASTRSGLVRQALLASPGITRVAAFGRRVPAGRPASAHRPRRGSGEPAPAVEIYAVAGTAPRAWTAPLASAVTVHGGPEGVLALEERGLVTGRPVLLAGESSVGTGSTAVTDALLRRERNFGRFDRRDLRRPDRGRAARRCPGRGLRPPRARAGAERRRLRRRDPVRVEFGVGRRGVRRRPARGPAVGGGRLRHPHRLAAGGHPRRSPPGVVAADDRPALRRPAGHPRPRRGPRREPSGGTEADDRRRHADRAGPGHRRCPRPSGCPRGPRGRCRSA